MHQRGKGRRRRRRRVRTKWEESQRGCAVWKKINKEHPQKKKKESSGMRNRIKRTTETALLRRAGRGREGKEGVREGCACVCGRGGRKRGRKEGDRRQRRRKCEEETKERGAGGRTGNTWMDWKYVCVWREGER